MRIVSTWSFGLRANEEAWPHVEAIGAASRLG